MSVFRSSLSPTVRENLQLVTDALRGLQTAMEQRSCNDPVIQQLDSNMIEIFNRLHGLK